MVNNYLLIAAILFLFVIILRITETLLINSNHSISDDILTWQFYGLINDFGFVSKWLLILSPLYILLGCVNPKTADSIIIIIGISFLLIDSLLIYYFNESLTPLSVNNLTGMSVSQLSLIGEIYGLRIGYLIFVLPLLVILFFIFWKIKTKLKSKVVIVLSGLLLLFSITTYSLNPIKSSSYNSEINYHVVINKTKYFIDSYDLYLAEKNLISESKINKELIKYRKLNKVKDSKFNDYPFYSEKRMNNVLGDFFVKRDTAPNIVFIISESLGKIYSGSNSRLGSFTPFLDSLANHSLYWENLLANAERTFGAIPNLMAGVPEGDRGFLNLGSSMPDHLSLPLLLKELNGYQTGFYCGAWQEFDNMDDYLMFQKFDFICGKKSFKKNLITKQIENEDGTSKAFNWGAEDLKVFKESLELMDKNYDESKPYFNLFLSTSFHKPYAYSNENGFRQKAQKRITKINPSNPLDYKSRLDAFAAIMYVDNSMREFFEMYKKREDFKNTIFVIVGDHSLKFLSDNSRLEKYHVPLLIYSPLLEKSKSIKSVACQKDVPSALQALLMNNFNLNLPEFSISQSNNLDTLTEFSISKSNHALMYADKRMNNYLFNDYFYSDGIVFKVSEGLKIERINNDSIRIELENRLNNYKIISNYTCQNNAYLPPSVYSEFINSITLFKRVQNFENEDEYASQNYNPLLKTNEEVFESNFAYTNKGGKYLNILEDQFFIYSKRVRTDFDFKIKCPQGNFPSLVIIIKTFKNNIEKVVAKKVILLNNSTVKAIGNNGWYRCKAFYWLDSKDTGVKHSLASYFFFNETDKYFIDDIEINMKEY